MRYMPCPVERDLARYQAAVDDDDLLDSAVDAYLEDHDCTVEEARDVLQREYDSQLIDRAEDRAAWRDYNYNY